METVAERDAQALRLRAEGLTYGEIGERMGETKRQAWTRCNRNRDHANNRNYKLRNRTRLRAYNRAYEEAHRRPCEQCGQPVGRGNETGICGDCISDEHDRKMRKLVRLWAEGLTYPEIQAEMGWSKSRLSVEMHRARAQGYDLPYRYTTGNRAGRVFFEQMT